jgi:hypothetical protein
MRGPNIVTVISVLAVIAIAAGYLLAFRGSLPEPIRQYIPDLTAK